MNKQIIFVTATNTDVGKTYACEKLLERYASEGKDVGYFKPIETGVVSEPLDGTKLLNKAKDLNKKFDVTIDDVVPYQFKLPAAPFIAKDKATISIQKIKEKAQYLLKFCDTLIIEGAGGLMVPIEKNYFMIDLIKEFECKTVLITPSKLGCINDTLLSIAMLQSKNIDFEWYVNLYKEKKDFETITLPFYKEYFDTIKFI
ncbi:MAG: dethiobiotin synthase [Campylobacterota bacterium]|nr:dethiobiotin synthase [Campylobacterota bacterium]